MATKVQPAISEMADRMISKNCNAMKNIFSKIMLLAVAATAFASCAKDAEDTSIDVKEKFIEVTLKAEKPATVRTEMIDGIPHWSIGDAIGVYLDDTNKHYQFTNDSEEATLTTTFSGQTAVTDKLYPYYPYTSNGAADKGAKVDIPVNQNPTATSFDGAADIMIAKPITLDAEGTQLANLEFARVGAIVKIVLKDNTSSLAAQHISSLTMTAESNLVGRVYLDVINQQLGELYYGQSKSVTATYTEDTQFVVNGENAVYVIVYPQTLSADTTLAFEASTEHYAIAKEITLPNDIALEMGKVTTLNVSLTAEHLTAEESGLALPFEDNFSWVGNTSTTAFSSITSKFPTRDGAAMYSAVAYTYPEANTALKFSSSSKGGTLTTTELNLSQPFSVVVNAKYYSATEKSMTITVGETSKTITLSADYADYVVTFDAASAKEKITISNSKRFYLSDLKVVDGHDYVLPPALTVSTDTISVSSAETVETFTYSVENPVDGTNVDISDDADWITTTDNEGTVTVTIEENTAEQERTGTITVKYGELSEEITVTQAAAGGSAATTLTIDSSFFTGTYNKTEPGNTFTVDGYDFYGFYTMKSTTKIQMYKNQGYVANKSSLGKITKIVVTYDASDSNQNCTLYVGTSERPSTTTITASKNGNVHTYDCSTGSYSFFKLKNGSGAGYVTTIEVTFEN